MRIFDIRLKFEIHQTLFKKKCKIDLGSFELSETFCDNLFNIKADGGLSYSFMVPRDTAILLLGPSEVPIEDRLKEDAIIGGEPYYALESLDKLHEPYLL